MILSTLAFARFDAVLLLLLGESNPTPADWSTWARAYCRSAAEHGVRHLLLVTHGGGPNAAQLQELQHSLVRVAGTNAAEHFRTATCGDSAVVRFISATLGWLYAGAGMQSFSAGEQPAALRFLGLGTARQSRILAAVPVLRAALRSRAGGGKCS